MRPAPPVLERREALSAYVEDYADRVDGRVGVCLARLDDADELDVVAALDPDRPYTAASVIKLPLVYALYRRHDGDLDVLGEPHGLAPENRVGGSGLLHLLDSVNPTLRGLARATIAVSDNAAANELIDYLGVDAVNDAADALGMCHTHIGRKMMTTDVVADDATADRSHDPVAGDQTDAAADSPDVATAHDLETGPTNTTSPLDCARFFAALLRGDGLSDRATDEIVTVLGCQTDASLFPRYLPPDVDVAHKTGRLPGAALDTGVVGVDGETPLCFAVFVEGLERGGDGSDVVAEIGDATYAWWNRRNE